MNDNTDRTFRLGDRVRLRVPSRKPHWNHTMFGDVIGVNLTINNEPSDKVCVGWADGSKSWESPIELRLVTEQ